MVSLRKGKNLRTVVVRKLAANRGPRTVQRVIEFPNPPAADDVISERIIFEVGDDRFAINWTAKIERLPPAGRSRTEVAETRTAHLRSGI